MGHPGEAVTHECGSPAHRRSGALIADVHRLRGRPAALAGLPAGRAAAQRGGGAARPRATRSRRCSTSTARPPSPRTRCSPACSPRRTRRTTRRRPSSAASPRAAARRQGRRCGRGHRHPGGGRAAGRARSRGPAGHRRRARPGDRRGLAAHRSPTCGSRWPPGSRSSRTTRTTGTSLPDDDPRAQAHDIYEWVGATSRRRWSTRSTDLTGAGEVTPITPVLG